MKSFLVLPFKADDVNTWSHKSILPDLKLCACCSDHTAGTLSLLRELLLKLLKKFFSSKRQLEALSGIDLGIFMLFRQLYIFFHIAHLHEHCTVICTQIYLEYIEFLFCCILSIFFILFKFFSLSRLRPFAGIFCIVCRLIISHLLLFQIEFFSPGINKGTYYLILYYLISSCMVYNIHNMCINGVPQ